MYTEIIKEWAAYNGTEAEEKRPDGTKRKVKHHKIWAVAITATGHVYVRYGPAKQPLHLTEQIIRPNAQLTARKALEAAEHILQEKVEEKRKKGYEEIAFHSPPYYVPSFSRVRMNNEPETAIAPVMHVDPPQPETALAPALSVEAASPETLKEHLVALSKDLLETPCVHCHQVHSRYLVDIGLGQYYTPDALLKQLEAAELGRSWLSTPCRLQDQQLQTVTGEHLGTVQRRQAEDVAGCALSPEPVL
jgi:hypothetical protein